MLRFSKYSAVGILNTAIHWIVFYLLTGLAALQQSYANLIAFLVAMTFGFVFNSLWTFSTTISLKRYFYYAFVMGFIAFIFGAISDIAHFPRLITLVAFSGCSLFFGYLSSKHLIFRTGK